MQELTFKSFIHQNNMQEKEAEKFYSCLARHYGLPDCLFWILYFLRENGGTMRQADLVDSLALSKQTVHSALKSAREAGILSIENAPESRRNNLVSLAPEGEMLADTIADRVLALQETAFRALHPDDRAALLRIQREYLTALQQAAAEELAAGKEESHAEN